MKDSWKLEIYLGLKLGGWKIGISDGDVEGQVQQRRLKDR
jgi:hypothetical protein